VCVVQVCVFVAHEAAEDDWRHQRLKVCACMGVCA